MVSSTIGIAAIVGVSTLSIGNHTFANNMYANTNTNTAQVKTIAAQPKPVAKIELAAEEKPTETPTQPVPKMVTVQPGDYLEKIATGNGTTALRMFYANTSIAKPDLIYPGQQLRVPTPDEVLTPREVPVPAPVVVETPVPAATSQSAVAPAPRAVTPAPTPAPTVSGGGVWDSLAACESGGNWAINTGNGYYGGLQFTLSSWRGVGGSGLPNQASREEQIMRAQILQSRSGWGAWPACSAKLGLR